MNPATVIRRLGRHGGGARGWPVRAVAVATVAYSVAITVAPPPLAKPTGLARSDGGVPADVAALIRSIGTRDAVLAAALALSPAGYPTAVLTVARVVADGVDAFWFGRLVHDRSARAKVSGAAAGWAVVEAVVGWWAASDRRDRHEAAPSRS